MAKLGFDPFGLERHHARVRDRILAQQPGYAQTVIGDVMVSYEAAAAHGLVFLFNPLGQGWPPRQGTVLDELIIDLAHGEAIASPLTFNRIRVERLVADYASYPPDHLKLCRRASLLQSFYLDPGAPGSVFLF